MREVKEKEREGERKEDQELRRFVALCEKQSNKVAGKALCKCAAGSHNVCDAPLCGCMSKHFTRSFVAQRFKSAFHVFALAKTFHFCAEDMLAYCSLLSAQKFHVRSNGARFRTLFIVPLRRTSCGRNPFVIARKKRAVVFWI